MHRTVLAVILVLGVPAFADVSDNFENGVIDPSLWVFGGAKRGWDILSPSGVGDWEFSHDEIADLSDGYLKMKVWGPASPNTYGAEAWARTVYDYNDGQSHVANFTWGAEVVDTHYNTYFIHITDGFIPDPAGLHWQFPDWRPSYPALDAGTTELSWTSYPSGLPKTQWSITIDPSGVARLYDGPDATGLLLREESLHTDKPWHLRFMVSDGTSGGFPAGDAALHLYSYESTSSEPAPGPQPVPAPGAALLGLLGLGMVAWVRRRHMG